MVAVLRYVVCDDFGTAVNPLIVRGQVQGGVAQGFGQAVMEHTAYDRESLDSFCPAHSWTTLCRGPTICRISRSNCSRSPAPPIPGSEGRGRGGRGRQSAGGDERDDRRVGGDGVTQLDMPATPEVVWQSLRLKRAA